VIADKAPFAKYISHEMFEEFKALAESIAGAGAWSPDNLDNTNHYE
jgi:hypothetical protein